MEEFADFQTFQTPRAQVYAASLRENAAVRDVCPPLRNDYILSSDVLRRQRYAVWRLLDIALLRSTGKGVDSWQFVREPSGKWTSPDLPLWFSLAHSSAAVAVALSSSPVGVDVQRLDAFRADGARLARRILTPKEQERFRMLPEGEKMPFLARCWCAKEAIFKKQGVGAFSPASVRSDAANVFFFDAEICGERHILSVAD